MSTPEEIKKIAREYVEYRYRSYNSENRERVINNATNELSKILEWLSKDYCIVPKSDIKRYYNVDKCTIRDYKKRCGDKAQTRAAARIRLCETLFGTALFNEEKL